MEWFNNFEQWLEENYNVELVPLLGTGVGKLIAFFAVLFIGLMVARIAKRVTGKALARARVDATLAKFFANMARYAILVLVGIFCLGIFGIQTASLAAVLAAAGFAVGLSLQGSLGNFAAGVLLLLFRPFKVDDVVNVAGVTGKVNAIDLFTTEMTTPDNRRLIVPNGSIFGSTIENITHYPKRRVSVPVGVEYAADLDATRKALEKAVSDIPDVLPDPAPQVFLSSLGDSAVNWEIRVWAETPKYWAVYEAGVAAVKRSLDDAKLGIPFPQMDIHLDPEIAAAMGAKS